MNVLRIPSWLLPRRHAVSRQVANGLARHSEKQYLKALRAGKSRRRKAMPRLNIASGSSIPAEKVSFECARRYCLVYARRRTRAR